MATGDFNNDGNLDLATANYTANTVSVLLANGNGTFQAVLRVYATGTQPISMTTGDFNGDGNLDLAVADSASSGDVSVLLGNGDGTFQTQIPYRTESYASSVVTDNFSSNSDSNLDLAVADRGSDKVSIPFGNGDGTFQNQVPYATGSVPISVTTGDFNGDGSLDIAIANFGDGGTGDTVSVLLANGDGTFVSKTDYITGSGPHSVTAGDFNGDGKLDLAVASEGSNTVSILLGNGDGTFQAKLRLMADGLAAAMRLHLAAFKKRIFLKRIFFHLTPNPLS